MIKKAFKIIEPHLKEVTLLSLIVLLSFFIYRETFGYYFLQDDWFHFNISKVASIEDFLKLFNFRQDIIGWRPIPKQFFFLIVDVIFHKNPLIAHTIIYSFFCCAIVTIFFIAKNLFNDVKSALVSAFLYSTATFHFTSLAWLSAGENIVGTAFFLLASFLMIKFLQGLRRKNLIYSYIFFFLSLASTEFAITWPIFIVFISFMYLEKKTVKKIFGVIKYLAPIILLIIIYLIIRLFIYKLPAKDDYKLIFDIKALKTLFWYVLWFLNLPEVLKYNLILSKLTFSIEPSFTNPFKFYLKPLSVFFVLEISSLLFLSYNLATKQLLNISITFILFVISLSLVIFLPNHTFPYYLSIPSTGLILLISNVISKQGSSSKIYMILFAVFLVSWFFTSFLSISFTKKTHWIPGEQKISKNITSSLLLKYPNVPENSKILIYPASIQDKQALMDQQALITLYGKNVETVYLNEDPLTTINSNFFLKTK